MKKLLTLCVAVGLGASALASAPTAGAAPPPPPTFGHWAGSGDRDIPIVNSTTAPWTDAFNHAVSVWSPSTVLNLVPELGVITKASREKCKGILGKIRVCNYPYGKAKGWAGIAKTSFAGEHIVQARVKLNQSLVKPGSFYDTHLTCHEVGHAIGLDHSATPPDPGRSTHCLTPVLNDGDDTPDATDFTNLQNEYGHTHALLRSSGDIDVTITHKDGLTIRTVKVYPPR